MASKRAKFKKWITGSSPKAIAAWIAYQESLEPPTITDEEWEAMQQVRGRIANGNWQMLMNVTSD